MKILIQKFGGTSGVDEKARTAVKDKVQQAIRSGYAPVVVVSAIGRKGAPYATDTLIDFLKQVNLSVNVREQDMLMCCGEIISACIMAATLQKFGFNAMALTGGQAGIITDSQFGAARIKNIKTDDLRHLLESGVIPVICGFQGMTENHGKFTTLGRGGSDVTAAALGVALNAEKIEIYTDVEGVMTADPRIVKDATILHKISYAEVAQMAQQGAKVIHPRAVEIAMRRNIPLVVKSTFSDAPGTLITSDISGLEVENSVTERRISGVTYLKDLVQFRVQLDTKDASSGRILFEDLAAAGISVSCLNLSESSSMFAVFSADAEKTVAVLDEASFAYTVNKNCAKVSVVFAAVRGFPGLMAKFVSALADNKIHILQTVDSDTTISAIVKEEHINEAVTALHKAFKL